MTVTGLCYLLVIMIVGILRGAGDIIMISVSMQDVCGLLVYQWDYLRHLYGSYP